MMIEEVGLVRGHAAHSTEHQNWLRLELTWQGHELLEAVRDSEIWRYTTEGAKKVGNAGLEFLWDLAKAYAKHFAKERLGIDLRQE